MRDASRECARLHQLARSQNMGSGAPQDGDATSTSLGLVGATSGVVQISVHEPTVEVERLQ